MAIEETYYDLCEALSFPLLEHPETTLIEPLEKIIGGQVKLESDRFYIHFSKHGKQEISLIAEGLRKIAMLNYLIANDSLKKGNTLFWDEPEANLNPRMIKKIAVPPLFFRGELDMISFKKIVKVSNQLPHAKPHRSAIERQGLFIKKD